MRHAIVLLAIIAFVPLASATAQEPPPVKVGDRVRVTAPDVRSAGIVQLLTTDSLVMRPEYVFVMRPEYVTPNRLAIPLASVTRRELGMPGARRQVEVLFTDWLLASSVAPLWDSQRVRIRILILATALLQVLSSLALVACSSARSWEQ